jgi:hypothetical protein
MSFVKNRDALHRLNNLLMTVKLENANGKDHSLYDYEETVDRLLTETLAEKKDKKLDEKYLQRYWVWSNAVKTSGGLPANVSSSTSAIVN